MTSLVITALLSAALAATPAAAAEFYTIDRNDLNCVAANAEFYKSRSSGEVVEIDLPSCKSPQNNPGPTRRYPIFPPAVTNTPENNSKPVTNTKIRLSKAQLTCLSDNNFVMEFIPRFSIEGDEDHMRIPADFTCP